jgi:hypothetical protein
MIENADPPSAAVCPSLADATKIVPKMTSAVVTIRRSRPAALPRGNG